jgi:hypothetical protein
MFQAGREFPVASDVPQPAGHFVRHAQWTCFVSARFFYFFSLAIQVPFARSDVV